MAKKKSTTKGGKAKSQEKARGGAAVESALPFKLEAGRDYRVTFQNGQAVVYYGAALTHNPTVNVEEIAQVHDELTGEVVFKRET